MRYFILASISVLLLLLGWRSPQTYTTLTTSLFPWEPVGPANLGHEVHTVLRVGNTIYLGSAFGGLFRSTDNGQSWSAVPGFNLNQNGEAVWRCPSVTALATDGTRLFVGSGAASLFNPAGVSISNIAATKGGVVGFMGRPSMGVFVSEDGGNTFSNTNATWSSTYPNVSYTHSANDWLVAISLDAHNGKILAATHNQLYVTTDNFATVTLLSFTAPARIMNAVWGDNDYIFVATRDSIYRSTDGGQTFSSLTSSLPRPSGVFLSGLGGGQLIVRRAPSDPRTIYVASAKSDFTLTGVWISRDNGDTWTRLSNTENDAFAVLGGAGTLALAVDPQDPLHIVIGGSQLWEFSPNFGWRRINPANQDAFILRYPSPIWDVAFLANGDLLVVGRGRPVRITQGGTRMEDASRGLQLTRVLSVAVSPSGYIYASGPAPLNIVNRAPNDPPGGFRLINQVTTIFDGVTSPLGLVVTRLTRPGHSFFSYQGGRIRFSEDDGVNYLSVYGGPRPDAFYNDPSDNTQNVQWCPASGTCTPVTNDAPSNWGPLYPPMVVAERFAELVKDANNVRSDTFFLFAATGGYLWTVTFDSLFRWSRVSDLNITTPSGLNAAYPDYVNATRSIPTAIAVDSNYTVWVGTSDGKLYRIRNAHNVSIDRTVQDGVEDLTSAISSLVDGRWISAISVHPLNPDLLAIAVGSYNGTDRIFVSTNATSATPTFTTIQANLPQVPVYSLFLHPDSTHLLLAGTEWGLWRCQDVRTPTWEEMTGEAIGRVPVTSITWKPYRFQVDTVDRTDPNFPKTEERLLADPERPVYIGTWGRGIWKISSQSATSLPTATAQRTPITISAFPNPFLQDFTIHIHTATPLRYVTYKLYTITGALAAGGTYRELSSGTHQLQAQSVSLTSGVYLLSVEAIDQSGRRYNQTLKLIRP